MSFASDIKIELLAAENRNHCCALAELCGIVCFAAHLEYTNDGYIIKISTENEAVAKRTLSLIKRVFGILPGIELFTMRKSQNKNIYLLIISGSDNVQHILSELSMFDENFNSHVVFHIDSRFISSLCCKKAFIRGAFLGSGSINAPQKAYHFEIVTRHFKLSGELCEVLRVFGLNPKVIIRKSNYVVYFKDSKEILDVLNVMGAHKSLMEFLNERIVKDKRNDVNRLVNCETANLDKTVDASVDHVMSIEKIRKKVGLKSLPPQLYDIAKLRLRYRQATLKDLGAKLNPPISKSGVNHRLRKIMELAERL